VERRADMAAARPARAARPPGPTVLETAPLQPATKARCQQVYEEFVEWAAGRALDTLGQVGVALALWLGVLYLGGGALSAGSWGCAAATYFAGLDKGGASPAAAHAHVPYVVVATIVAAMLAMRKRESALAVLLILEHLRLGETSRIRSVYLAPPVARVSGAAHGCIAPRAAETERESKTGEFAESLSLDLWRQTALGLALKLMVAHRLGAEWWAAQRRFAGAGSPRAAPLFAAALRA
ncbi:unnamed protein product, partial [Prorocentrum cordatum]